jgi:beta-glucosidase
MDIGPKFLDKDGKLSRDIMPDLLHPNAKGYTIWAAAIEPTVAKLMGEK